MRAARTIGLSAIACASLLLAACQNPGDPRGVLLDQQDAWNAGDLDAFIERGYWNSPNLTFFSGGDVTRGFAPFVERFRSRYAAEGKEMGELTFSEVERVHADVEVALVRGRWQLTFADGSSTGGLFTLFLRRIGGGWKIAHDHTSVAEAEKEE